MSSQAISELMALRDDPYSRARSWKEASGGKVVGFFCCYSPEELIHAAGALPVRITGENRAIERSGAHLQSYCCSLARTALDMALTGELDFLEGTSFAHTCDTMMRLSDIWRLNAGLPLHLDAVLPVRLEGEAAMEYVHEELAGFREKLEGEFGPISDGTLWESIKIYNRNRELLSKVYNLRFEKPGVVPCDQALLLTFSSALMEKSEHNSILERAVEEMVSSEASSEEKVHLFGIGSVMDQWDFLSMLESVGGTLIDDDFCTGRRYFDTTAPEDGDDPLMSLTRRITERPVCPCKHAPLRSRSAELAERLERSGARGALFFQFKFCEPHAFDYPYVKEALDERGIPSLYLEIEHGSVSIERLRTRVEAMLETIRGD